MSAYSSQSPPAASENLRQFKRWMRDVLRRPSMWEALREGIGFEDPVDPFGFIEVIRDAENGCAYNLKDLDRQIRGARLEPLVGRNTCVGLIVCAEESTYWNGRLRWLQASRQQMEQLQRRGRVTSRHDGFG
jgi:hypothetical protein